MNPRALLILGVISTYVCVSVILAWFPGAGAGDERLPQRDRRPSDLDRFDLVPRCELRGAGDPWTQWNCVPIWCPSLPFLLDWRHSGNDLCQLVIGHFCVAAGWSSTMW